jgi:hypothetical protein
MNQKYCWMFDRNDWIVNPGEGTRHRLTGKIVENTRISDPVLFWRENVAVYRKIPINN